MDQGPESKKARLSTTGSPWAPSGSSVAVNSSHHRHHAGSLPSPNPAAAHHQHQQHQHQHSHPHLHHHSQHAQQHHHPTPPSAVPYQAAHPSSSSSNITTTSSSFPPPPEYLPPPATSPAPPTPVSAHSYTHTNTLPPPSTNSNNTNNGRLSHPHPHHLDDRRHHDPDPYTSGQDHRQQDYRQHQQQQPPPPQPDAYRQDPRQPPDYRQDYRFPPPHPYSTPYGRSDKQQPHQQVNDDPIRNRPGSAASAGGAHGQQQQHQQQQQQQRRSPTPSQLMDDRRRQMSFENLAHPAQPQQMHPNAGTGHPPQQQQPMHHLPQQPHTHTHLHGSAPPPPLQSQPQPQPQLPPGPPVGGATTMYRPPTYPPTTPTTISQTPAHQPPPPPQQYEQPPMYNHAPSVAPQPADIMYPISYASAAGKKKAQRASQACDSCRSLKAKCDETKPCKNCREKNIECKYRDPIPKQQDKVTADILESINMMRSEMDSIFMGELRGMRHELVQRISTLERAMKSVTASMELDTGGGGGIGGPLRPGSSANGSARDEYLSPEDMDVGMSNAQNQTPQEKLALPPDEAQRITRQMQDDYTLDVVPGPTVPPGEPAIPAYHTTLAGLLLTWPTIRERVHHLLEAEGIHYLLEYPIRQEEQRGNIRFHGRGEGFDRKKTIRGSDHDPGSQLGALPMERAPSSRSSSQGSSADGDGDGESAPYPGEMWGQIGGLSPPNHVDFIKGTPLKPNGDLDFSPEKVWKYVKSYEENIQNIHPLIIPKELYAMVTQFLETLPRASATQTSRPWGPAPVATFAASPELSMSQSQSQTVEGSLKRKRSPAPEGSGGGGGSPSVVPTQPLKPGQPFRTIESALVLVILALGKICLYRHARIPDVVPEHDAESPPPNSQSSPAAITSANNNGYSPAASVQDSPSSAVGVGPGHAPSRRTSMQSGQQVQLPGVNAAGAAAAAAAAGGIVPSSSSSASVKGGPSVTMKRNIDDIPGLEYFAASCDIIGAHLGGRELKHVWALILGCLYYGQLGRPIQSLELVAIAGRHLQAIIRPNLHRYGMMRAATTQERSSDPAVAADAAAAAARLVRHKRDNQYIFAFWTCLQLESDILAELQLPPSGILSYEQQMPYPSGEVSLEQGFDEYVLQSYAAQLYLRNQLNDIHKNLYDGRQDQQKINYGQIEVFADVLQTHRWVPPRFQFRDEDPPARDILAARLRAKYWGAQVIVHRFFIRHILEVNYNKRMREEKRRAAADGDEDTKLPAEDPAVLADEEEAFAPRSLQLARRGIQALVESTRAFHGIPDKRFIITNVFGTAHAQWGNLLILDSIQRDPVLGRFLGEDLVNDLFRKTIAFFEIVSQPSSSLGYDMRILKGLYQRRLAQPLSIPQEPLPPPPPPPPSAFYQLPPAYPMMSAATGTLSSSMPAPEWFQDQQARRQQHESPQQQHPHPPPPPPPPPPPSQHPVHHSSPMQMSPMAASPVQQMSPVPAHQQQQQQQQYHHHATPTSAPGHPLQHHHQQAYGSSPPPPSSLQSPVQGRLPPLPFGPPPVKTPSTPSDSGFPHHLPPFDQRRPYD